jgi:endonuclease YncB( thermonuclease family)
MGGCLSAIQQVVTAVDSYNDDGKPQTSGTTPAQGTYAAAAAGASPGTTTTAATTHQPAATTTSSSGLSPYYSSLPSNAEKVTVRNVYDGDTLTLSDERRVRLLGIDTPEIKEKQAMSQEAKAHTKNLCGNGQSIWISFEGESKENREDHYGRLLAFVWVQKDGQYLCVNEGILAVGLANAYVPNSSTKLHNWDKMLALQSQARENHRGIWQSFQDATVFKTKNGSAYHQKTCEHLSGSYNLQELKVSEASAMGLHPCRTCMTG